MNTADQFEAELRWLGHEAMVPGRAYPARINGVSAAVIVTAIKYRRDRDSGAHLAAKTFHSGDVGNVTVSFDRPVPFETSAHDDERARFVIEDRVTHAALGEGTIRYALHRSENIRPQAIDVDGAARAALKNQQPRCIWLTGLSGSGKSTLANLLDRRLHAAGFHTFVLDGDNVRHGLNRDLGFTEADRAENIRRIAEVSRLMTEAGLIVIVAFISPYRAERAFARGLFKAGEFVEVFVDTPLQVCEERDPKGLYAKARAGKLPNFTGYDSPYEPPTAPELVIRTIECSPDEAVDRLALLAVRRSSGWTRASL